MSIFLHAGPEEHLWLAKKLLVTIDRMARSPHNVTRSTLIVISFFGLSKLTGFVKLLVLTNVFGAGPDADAYTAAGQLPELFQVLIAGGALAAALIPVYSRHLKQGGQTHALQLARTVITLVVLLLGGLCLIGIWLAPWLVSHVLVPEFDLERQNLTASLMRIFLISTVILGVSGVASSLLNAHQHFLLPALATVVIDLGSIAGLVLLVPQWGITGAAWGMVFGAILHLAVQIPAMARYHLTYAPNLSWQMSGVREIVRLMGPRVLTMVSVHLADIFIVRLASNMPTGSVAAYFYGFLIMQVPLSLFGSAIAVVVFPTMAERFNDGDFKGLRQISAEAMVAVWALTVPATIGLVALGPKGIAFVLQRGAFDSSATALVYLVLIAFSLRIVAEASLEIVARLFYARHNTIAPMWIFLGWLSLILVSSKALGSTLGLPGLALATSLAFALSAAGLYVVYRRLFEPLPEGFMLGWLGHILLAAIVMGILVRAIDWIFASNNIAVMVSILVGAVCYISLIRLARPNALSQLLAQFRGHSLLGQAK